jgi:transcription-repair coupling factor (superfamily II helicase)
MLGGQQSGHIDAVGFEMYTSMLDRAVRELKGEAAAPEVDVQLNLGLNIRIPANYIAEENQRLRIYKRVAGVEDEAQLAEVRAELQDRYGTPPREVESLFQYATLRLLCRRVGVAGVDRRREQISIRFTEGAAVDPARLAQFVAAEHKQGAHFTPAGVLTFTAKAAAAEELLRRLHEVLVELAAMESIPADRV